MHDFFLQIVALKAKGEKVTEHEIYTRFLRDNPRHYERGGFRILSTPPYDKAHEMPAEEYLH